MLDMQIGVKPSGPNGKYTRGERLRAALLSFVATAMSLGVMMGAFTLMDRYPNESSMSNVLTGVGILFTFLMLIAGVATLIHLVAAPFAPSFFEGAAVDAALAAVAARDSTLATLTPFQVSTTKFVVMSLVTLGFYALYWSYQHWKRIKALTGESLSPFWRAFFGPLWAVSLFGRIRSASIARGVPATWSAAALGLSYLVLNVLYRLPDPWWLVSMLSFVPAIPVVRTASALNGAGGLPAEDPNSRFSGLNIVGIVIGGATLVLGVIGTFLPDPTVPTP